MKKTILLSGGTGYLGSSLAHALLREGHRLILLKRASSSIARIKEIFPLVACYDIDSIDYLNIFKSHTPIDAVIHTATCYGRNGENFIDISHANIDFPLKLLDAAIRSGVKFFVNTDSALDKYLNFYSLSKSHFTEWGKVLSAGNQISFVNMKLEHFFGPSDSNQKFTAHVVNSCLNNVPELKLTPGEQMRDFIYIDDVVSAFFVVLENLSVLPGNFNEFDVGSGTSISVKDFVRKVHQLTNSKTKLVFGAIPYRNDEMMNSRANIKPLVKLGWSCNTSLNCGLKLTIEGNKP